MRKSLVYWRNRKKDMGAKSGVVVRRDLGVVLHMPHLLKKRVEMERGGCAG